jgi:glycerol-3-phosphate acyltransferase PlsY
LGLAFVATWLLMYKVGKISSLSALIASALSPIYAWLIATNMTITLASLLMAAFLLWRHKSNIQRLLSGQES